MAPIGGLLLGDAITLTLLGRDFLYIFQIASDSSWLIEFLVPLPTNITKASISGFSCKARFTTSK